MLRNEIRKIVKEEITLAKKEIVTEIMNTLMGKEVKRYETNMELLMRNAPIGKVCKGCLHQERTEFPDDTYRCFDMECGYYKPFDK
jgi:hypothetical protein